MGSSWGRSDVVATFVSLSLGEIRFYQNGKFWLPRAGFTGFLYRDLAWDSVDGQLLFPAS